MSLPRILKYEITPPYTIIGKGAECKPISAAFIGDKLFVWAEVEESLATRIGMPAPAGVMITPVPTGEYGASIHGQFIDTAINSAEGDTLVFHIYASHMRRN